MPSKNSLYCPVCKNFSEMFLPFGLTKRKNAKWPNCGALERHRLVWLFFKRKTNLFNQKSGSIKQIV